MKGDKGEKGKVADKVKVYKSNGVGDGNRSGVRSNTVKRLSPEPITAALEALTLSASHGRRMLGCSLLDASALLWPQQQQQQRWQQWRAKWDQEWLSNASSAAVPTGKASKASKADALAKAEAASTSSEGKAVAMDKAAKVEAAMAAEEKAAVAAALAAVDAMRGPFVELILGGAQVFDKYLISLSLFRLKQNTFQGQGILHFM
jgi:hypothetical protein